MTDSHDSTTASAIPRRGFLSGASIAALVLPAVAVATGTPTNAFAAASGISDAIEAHRTAWVHFDATVTARELAEDAFEPLPPHTLVKGLYGANYEARLGRDFALGNIVRDHESAVRSVRASLTKIGIQEQHITSSIGKATAKRDSAVLAVNAFFDAEEDRRAASPLGSADRAYHVANEAEETAWSALLESPCATLADVRAKAAYLVPCARMRDLSLGSDDSAALLQSLIGASA